MRPITTFVRHNSIKAILAAEKGLKAVSNGKIGKNLFDIEPKFIGTDVRIIKETVDSTFIAKCDTNGRIVNKPFKILVTTDLHLCDDKELINKSLFMLAKHVEAEKPDLILFTGDVVLTDHQQVDCIQFGKFMEKMGIYWAYVFGNHEARAEKEYHKYFMLKNLISFPHCLSKFGDPSLFGYGNFFINIMNSDNSIRQSFAFFDSGRDITDKYRKEYGLSDDVKGYDFIKNNQIEWFQNHIKALKSEYGDFKSMVFMHIPIPEYAEVMDIDENEKPVPIGRPNGKGEILFGEMHETVGCSVYNSGLFDKAREIGTQAFFSGHDHVNDYCALYKGVYLCYVQMGGYEIYHLDKFGLLEKQWIQGVTTLDIHNDGNIKIDKRFNRMYL